MHTDPNQFKNRKEIKVNEEQSIALQNKGKQFNTQLQIMQKQFNQSNDSIYFLVSVKFISQWRDYCLSDSSLRLSPHPMNYDLYQNKKLRSELVEKADFQVVNSRIYKLFEPYQDQLGLNKRQAIIIGRQKRVPIYLPSFKYIMTTLDICKSIDFNRKDIQDFKLSEVLVSEQSTLQHLVKAIKQKQSLTDMYQCRLWIPQKQLTIQKLHKLIKTELKPCSVATYKVEGVGRRIDDLNAKISQLMLDENSYFVLEAKSSGQKFVFVKDGEGRCQGCNHFGKLDFPCGCDKVKYCSQKCLQKDKVYHMRSCTYAQQMQLNKKVVMTKSPKNQNGLVGLNNLGNTCFMNSCLQCLSNTRPLTNYFLNQFFQYQINKVNPIGTKGKLAKNYAKFIKGMWCDEDDTYAPCGVKNAVSDINPMFSGYAQHDSQEFFSFLVDGLHEDLNRIQTKPYVEAVQQGNKSDIQLARQSWVAHIKRNQSIITDVMCGQYRSIVTCPDCNHKSTTFDPFITVTLPIPQNIQTVSEFFLIHHNMQKKNKRAWFKYSKKDADQWNRAACDVVGMDPTRCSLYVVSLKQNIYKVGRQSMTQIIHKVQSESKNMFLMEFSEQELSIPKQRLIQFTLRISKSTYHDSEQLFFKIPLVFDSKGLNGQTIYKKILRFLYNQAYDNSKSRKTFGWGGKAFEEYQQEMLKQRPFKLMLRLGKKIERTYHRIQIQFKKEIQINDQNQVIELIENQDVRVIDCEIDARFEKSKMSQFSFQKLKDFDTVGRQPKADKSQAQVGLDKCLQTFSSPETLESGNEWYCPKCKDHKLAKKELSIYRAPKILILHLKRFKQKGTYRKQKNESLVNFPLQLDMSQFLINQQPMQAYKQQIDQKVYISPKAQNMPLINYSTRSKPIYELYGISNHYGGLGGGHYTAYGKNNGQWYSFDDSHVSKAGKKEIVSSSAYLLFYERKD